MMRRRGGGRLQEEGSAEGWRLSLRRKAARRSLVGEKEEVAVASNVAIYNWISRLTLAID